MRRGWALPNKTDAYSSRAITGWGGLIKEVVHTVITFYVKCLFSQIRNKYNCNLSIAFLKNFTMPKNIYL